MQYRKDINGLRAIAVIAVVLFHFNASWLPGGFAGVDVFFVISGFLMTGIIFRGIEQENFSILKFYIARANRIIPALAVLCIVLLVFGWFYLSPVEYRALGKHAASSVSFLSNIIYLMESGYFDAASHEKWLLHTWSLSVEWQFYIIYPLVLVAIRKFMSVNAMKVILLLGTVLGFLYSIYATISEPNSAYYLLPTRMWEMMIGGVAYLYPIALQDKRKKLVEWFGLALIIGSYFFISKENLWPGYLAVFPVLGAFLIIQAQRNDSLITSNVISQKLGAWSYSIYLWHWPLVVLAYKLEIKNLYLVGIGLSIILGFFSWNFIENRRISVIRNWRELWRLKYLYIAISSLLFSVFVYTQNGLNVRFDNLSGGFKSPNRYCAVPLKGYQEPKEACEYFGENISWAVLGDSHSIELAYSLAQKLKREGIGLKQFSYQGCFPDYFTENSSSCTRWYTNALEYIIGDDNIENVVVSHRLSWVADLSLGNTYKELSAKGYNSLSTLDDTILTLAKHKKIVYVVYPIPEVTKTVGALITRNLLRHSDVSEIKSIPSKEYLAQNKLLIEHFMNTKYPSNVVFVDVKNTFCDLEYCYAVRDGKILYFDGDHPSTLATSILLDSVID